MPGIEMGGGNGRPENKAEKIPEPKEGQIWQLKPNFRRPGDAGLFKIREVDKQKDKVRIARLKEGKIRIGRPASPKFSDFSFRYTFLAENETELNTNYPNLATGPRVLNINDIDSGEPSKEKENVLELNKEMEEENNQGESENISEQDPESEKEGETGKITKNDFEQAKADFDKKRAAGEVSGFDNFILTQNGFQENDEVEIIYGNKVMREKIIRGAEGLAIGDLMNIWAIYSLDDDATIQKVEGDPGAAPQREPESAPTSEPVDPSATPEPGGETTLEPTELTPEQKKRAEIAERLGLSSELLAERALLEAAVDQARHDYVTNLYDHDQKLSRVLSILSLKKNPEPDEQYKTVYQEALENLRKFDSDHLYQYLENEDTEQGVRTQSVKSYIERYNRLEGLALWTEQQETRVKYKQDGWEKVEQSGKLGEMAKSIVDKVNVFAEKYQKLPLRYKLAIGAGAVGLHAGIAFISGPAAIVGATAWLGLKAVTGTAAYKTAGKHAEKVAHWGINKGSERQAAKAVKKASKESEYLDDYVNKLDSFVQQSIQNADKKLKAYEKGSFWAKAASLTVIFGVPLARYLGDVTNAATVADASYPDSMETAEIVDSGKLETPTPVAPESVVSEVPIEAPPTVAPESLPDAPATLPDTPTNVEDMEAAVKVETPEASKKIIIGEPDTPLDPVEKKWIDIRNKQGLFTDADEVEPEGYENNQGWRPPVGPPPNYGPEYEGGGGPRLYPASYEVPETSELSDSPHTLEEAEAMSTHQEVSPSAAPENLVKGTPFSETGNITTETPQKIPVTDLNTTPPVEGQAAVTNTNVSGSELHQEVQPTIQHASYEQSSTPTSTENFVGKYNFEDSKYQNLPIEERELWRENMTLLRDELLVMDHPEFGPNYHPGGWKSSELWRQYKENRIQDIVYFDQERYDHDPRDWYRDNLERQIGRRGIVLWPDNPRPTLGDGPDPYAIHSMDTIDKEYRHNLADMQRAAFKKFGNPALPLNGRETVQQYMARIATLYTRARLENPNFRLKF